MLPRRIWLLLGLTSIAVLLLGLCRHTFNSPKRLDAQAQVCSMLERDGQIDLPDPSCTLFVEGVQGKKLLHPLLKWRNEQGKVETIIDAREGDLRVTEDQKTLLLHLKGGKGVSLADRSELVFEERTWSLPLPANLDAN
jgi:hypothetical protein